MLHDLLMRRYGTLPPTSESEAELIGLIRQCGPPVLLVTSQREAITVLGPSAAEWITVDDALTGALPIIAGWHATNLARSHINYPQAALRLEARSLHEKITSWRMRNRSTR